MEKAIQFGAGNIGRGLIAPIIHNSHNITFIDTNESIVNEINKQKSYLVKILGEELTTIEINNIRALLASDKSIDKEIASASLLTTAVGPNVLEYIAPSVAKGIQFKRQNNLTNYLNIIACENMLGASDSLRTKVMALLTPEDITFANKYVGFVNCVVDRIVPPSPNKTNILEISVEDFYEWVIETKNFKGNIPNISGIKFTDNLDKYVERKIFTLNTGHAVTAYLGYKADKKTIKEAIEDKTIENNVYNAILESAEVLIKRYNINKEEHMQYIASIIRRFKNPYIIDEIVRVARDPKRKLSFNDRFIKPLRGTLEYNLKNDYLILGIASAFFFSNHYNDDKEAVEIKNLIANKGFNEAIKEITQINDDIIINKIINTYNNL